MTDQERRTRSNRAADLRAKEIGIRYGRNLAAGPSASSEPEVVPRIGLQEDDDQSLKTARGLSLIETGKINPGQPEVGLADEEDVRESTAVSARREVFQNQPGSTDRNLEAVARSEFEEGNEAGTVLELGNLDSASSTDVVQALAKLSSQMAELPSTIEVSVNAAIDAKLPEAIQARSAVIQEHIRQSLATEIDGKITERTAHFATQDALASVDARVAAVQSQMTVLQGQMSSIASDGEPRTVFVKAEDAMDSEGRPHDTDSESATESSSDEEKAQSQRGKSSARRGNSRIASMKGPKYRGLKELRSSHENFNRALSYRRYRLLNVNQRSGAKVSAMIGQYQRLTRHAMDEHAFSGQPPIGVLQFLSAFKTTCDDNDIPEGAAVRLMAKYLTGAAKRQFEAYDGLGTSRLRGFSSYPEAVQHLLETFATEEVIIEAVAKFDSLSQGEKENEQDFGLRVRDTARLCGNVFTENQLTTRFILGTHAAVKPVILSNKALWGNVSFEEVVRRAQAMGESHRALFSRRSKAGHAMAIWDQKSANEGQSEERRHQHSGPDDPVFAIGLGLQKAREADAASADTRYDHVFPDGCHEAHMVGREQRQVSFRQPSRSRMSTRSQVVGTRERTMNDAGRPGWVNPSYSSVDVCYACIGLGHRRPQCPHRDRSSEDPNFAFLRAENFKVLTPEQQAAIRRVGAAPEKEVGQKVPEGLENFMPNAKPQVYDRTMPRAGVLRRPAASNRQVAQVEAGDDHAVEGDMESEFSQEN